MSRSVPRNRTARSAVLGFPVRRPAPRSLSSRSTSALRRRIVLGLLVAARARADHGLVPRELRRAAPRRAGRGRERAAAVRGRASSGSRGRSATPTAGRRTSSTPAPRTRSCSAENELLRQQVIQNESALQQNVVLKRLLEYQDSPLVPGRLRRRRGRGDRAARGAVRAGDRRLGRLRRRRPRQRGGRHGGRARRHGDEA